MPKDIDGNELKVMTRVVRNTEILVHCREDDSHDKIHWYATSGEVGLSVNWQCVPFSVEDAPYVLEGLKTLVNELNKE